MTSGSTSTCGRITSLSECSVAAAAVGLPDTSAVDDGQNARSFDPPYCYFEGGNLKFNSGGGNTGLCTSTDVCVCKTGACCPPPQCGLAGSRRPLPSCSNEKERAAPAACSASIVAIMRVHVCEHRPVHLRDLLILDTCGAGQ